MGINRRQFLFRTGALAAASFIPLAVSWPVTGWAAQSADSLVLGFSNEPSSLDPHWHIVSANAALTTYLFDRLVKSDNTQRPRPGLAKSWKVIDDTTWEFELQPNVKFHNGEPLTVDDVIFSFDRASHIVGSPFALRTYLHDKTVVKISDSVFRIKTAAPNPIVPNELATVAIISRSAAKATTADYNSGKAVNGTGPYKLVNYIPGNRIVLTRNENYWSDKPQWKEITIRPISADGARVAALLSGDVNVIEKVAPTDIARLKSNGAINLTRSVTNRAIFLSFDHGRKRSPFIRDNAGQPIDNPLLDLRVRQAFQLAIDTQLIVRHILTDAAEVASQLVPQGIFGHSNAIKPVRADPQKAKALLTAAGYPQGFRITLHSPNDRFIRDSAVAQAVAQMLSRVGIKTEVETMPSSVFYKRVTGDANGSDFSFFLVGYGSATGESSSPLRSLLHTIDKEKGFGSSNRSFYSNKKVDALIEQGLITLDDSKREALFSSAIELAIADVALLPLYHPINVWGLRKPLVYPGRSDEQTIAMDIGTTGSVESQK
ncbi:ABC transporter substrate-binding protein [Superficieibacter electus]|nr:ABC transporter substrate-binding protein [Superficieibacter electus]